MGGPDRAALLLALALVVAGCAAPVHETETPTDADIEERGVGLPVDADVVFDRVGALMDADPPRPAAIRVQAPPEEVDTPANGSGSRFDPAPAFFEIMDVDTDPGEGLNRTEALALENGRTNLGLGTVLLFTGANDSRTVEYVLAHEFVHYVQGARDRQATLLSSLDRTTDAGFVLGSLIEGSAVFVTNAYIEAHLGGPPSTRLYRRLAGRLAPRSFAAYANSRYLLGREYVDGRIDDPTALDAVFANPPHTAEQLIHNRTPAEEPPRPLSVEAATGSYRRIGTDRLGEGFLRVAVRSPDVADADRAARGWGNDTLRIYRPTGDGRTSYAWIVRFDDARNRSQFLAALRSTLAARGEQSGGIWRPADTEAALRVASVGEETVVLLAGSESFVTETRVAGTNESVSLRLPGA